MPTSFKAGSRRRQPGGQTSQARAQCTAQSGTARPSRTARTWPTHPRDRTPAARRLHGLARKSLSRSCPAQRGTTGRASSPCASGERASKGASRLSELESKPHTRPDRAVKRAPLTARYLERPLALLRDRRTDVFLAHDGGLSPRVLLSAIQNRSARRAARSASDDRFPPIRQHAVALQAHELRPCADRAWFSQLRKRPGSHVGEDRQADPRFRGLSMVDDEQVRARARPPRHQRALARSRSPPHRTRRRCAEKRPSAARQETRDSE